ncbi:MAG: four helix bundle protein [Flavobacteriales bacterium]|nr:four helix bundle protein [Flavobacteriales bacterium]
MGKINGFKDLLVWQKGIEISIEVYNISANFPGDEKFGLTNQIRKAATSIALNIAEGYGRGTTKSYLSFLRNAVGSLYELETAIIIATKLNYLDENTNSKITHLIVEEQKMLYSLIEKIKDKSNN